MKRSSLRDNSKKVNHPEYLILRFNNCFQGIYLAPGTVLGSGQIAASLLSAPVRPPSPSPALPTPHGAAEPHIHPQARLPCQLGEEGRAAGTARGPLEASQDSRVYCAAWRVPVSRPSSACLCRDALSPGNLECDAEAWWEGEGGSWLDSGLLGTC